MQAGDQYSGLDINRVLVSGVIGLFEGLIVFRRGLNCLEQGSELLRTGAAENGAEFGTCKICSCSCPIGIMITKNFTLTRLQAPLSPRPAQQHAATFGRPFFQRFPPLRREGSDTW